jgi:hypothetical protein
MSPTSPFAPQCRLSLRESCEIPRPPLLRNVAFRAAKVAKYHVAFRAAKVANNPHRVLLRERCKKLTNTFTPRKPRSIRAAFATPKMHTFAPRAPLSRSERRHSKGDKGVKCGCQPPGSLGPAATTINKLSKISAGCTGQTSRPFGMQPNHTFASLRDQHLVAHRLFVDGQGARAGGFIAGSGILFADFKTFHIVAVVVEDFFEAVFF